MFQLQRTQRAQRKDGGERARWGRGRLAREGGRRAEGKRFGNLQNFRLNGGGRTGRMRGDVQMSPARRGEMDGKTFWICILQ